MRKGAWTNEKVEYYLKHNNRCFCRCIYWTWNLCCLELQNSSWTVCYAICTLVHKHFGVWSIYHCCVADLLCDKSNHQAQAEKEVSQFQFVELNSTYILKGARLKYTLLPRIFHCVFKKMNKKVNYTHQYLFRTET